MYPYNFAGALVAQYIKLPYTVQLSLRGILNLLREYHIWYTGGYIGFLRVDIIES